MHVNVIMKNDVPHTLIKKNNKRNNYTYTLYVISLVAKQYIFLKVSYHTGMKWSSI